MWVSKLSLDRPYMLIALAIAALHTSNHTLVHVLFSVFRSDVFAPVLPRIFLIGLTFSQPLLINRVIKYLNEPEAPDIKNVGYGLIGAYALVYTGIAVRPSPTPLPLDTEERYT